MVRKTAVFGAMALVCMVAPEIYAQPTLGTPTAQDLVQRCASRGQKPADRETVCTDALRAPKLADDLVARLYYYRGLARLDQRQQASALEDVDEALRRDAELWPARWVRADIRSGMRNHAAAAEDWAVVARQQTGLASPLVHQAIALDYGGQSAEAIAKLTNALEIAQSNEEKAQIYYHRGIIREHAHDWSNAAADYSQAIGLQDDMSRAYYGRGRVTLLNGKAADSLADLDKAASLGPENGYVALWQYIARSRVAGREASTLRDLRGALDTDKWPAPIIRALLGEISPAAAAGGNMGLRWSDAENAAAARCEIEFFLAQQHLIRGERDKAIARFEAVISTGIVEFIEYRAAQYELQRIRR